MTRLVLADWRARVGGAATLGAILGALPGAVILARLRDPAPTVLAGGALLGGSAILAALLAAWTTNLTLDRGRARLMPLLLSALAVGGLVGGAWVALVASGLWAATFPFPPYFGLVGFCLLQGALVGFVAMSLREEFDWDALDVAVSLAWAAVPPGLVVALLRILPPQG